MGGILHKLLENENEITVAYMTSGNIAVFDHDVRRHLDFLRRLAAERHLPERASGATWRGGWTSSSARKQPGDVDIARGAGHQAHHPRDRGRRRHPHPRAATTAPPGSSICRSTRPGKVRKDPIGPADVAIVRALLEEIAPDLVFVAGDLSDPHGTHRMCKEAIERALASTLRPADRGPRCGSIAGAWQEWPVTEADLAGAALPGGAPAQDPGDLQAPDRRRTPRRFPGRTSASSGSGSRRATTEPRPSSTGSGWRSTSRWKHMW